MRKKNGLRKFQGMGKKNTDRRVTNLVLTFLNLLETVLKQPQETTTNEQSVQSTANNPMLQVLPFVVLGAISLGAFIFNERRSKFPLVNFKLMLNRAILPANLIIVLV